MITPDLLYRIWNECAITRPEFDALLLVAKVDASEVFAPVAQDAYRAALPDTFIKEPT